MTNLWSRRRFYSNLNSVACFCTLEDTITPGGSNWDQLHLQTMIGNSSHLVTTWCWDGGRKPGLLVGTNEKNLHCDCIVTTAIRESEEVELVLLSEWEGWCSTLSNYGWIIIKMQDPLEISPWYCFLSTFLSIKLDARWVTKTFIAGPT